MKDIVISDAVKYIGADDKDLDLFESQYIVPNGVSYNSYVILDEQTVLLDTVDKSVSGQFFENLEHVLGNRPLDYMIVNHMEPDHCAIVEEVVRRFPEVKVVGNAKTFNMMKQFFTFDVDAHAVVIKEGDTISTGKHTLAFAMIPMVHWPEAMVTYDAYDKVLFSADAFGTFGALNGNVFADEVNFKEEWLDDARRYLVNIVGKYGASVQTLLKKAAGLEIAVICPLHGPIWRENLSYILEKYQKWSTYEAEDQAVVIMYASMYGNTASAADAPIKAFTDTADWTFSQQIPPPPMESSGHYLCTVAAGGHKKIVKPLRYGTRRGQTIVVNRQLCIANAFEEWIHVYRESLKSQTAGKEKMEEAISYIRENYAKDLNMAMVSNHICMNYSLFSAAFKEHTGVNFVNYLKEIRIAEAKRLLIQTEDKITEIAKQVGFENDKHFMKSFKTACGVSPSEFRKDYKMVSNGKGGQDE